MNDLAQLIDNWSDTFWTWAMVPVVLCVGLYFTFRTKVAQIRLVPEMFRTLMDPTPTDENGKRQSISSFQAFTVSAASRVGVGNIAGVGTAIVMGGPGAVFWMWLMAGIGAASSLIESTLAQAYKVRDKNGFRGGPAYYIERGLGSRKFGIFFAIILIFCFPFAFSSLQANTIVVTINETFGVSSTRFNWGVGIALTLLTGLVIFGGIRRIATITDKLVPVMATIYLIMGIIIVIINWQNVPWMIGHIVGDAFTINSVTGGAIGTVIMAGVKRGMFSNEAGLGSAPNAGATAAVTHPVKQGLVQTLGVYFDTWLVCSITAFIILSSQREFAGAPRGVALTHSALVKGLGSGAGWLLAIVVFMLAFSSIIGNYYYGESNIEFINAKPRVLFTFRFCACLAILLGSVAAAKLVWSLADAVMALLALTNLIAISLLARPAIGLVKDYCAQRKQGKDPIFTKDCVQLPGQVEFWNSAQEVTGSGEPEVADVVR